jgi:hypothetical protein
MLLKFTTANLIGFIITKAGGKENKGKRAKKVSPNSTKFLSLKVFVEIVAEQLQVEAAD